MNECSEVYGGRAAFSEPETRALRNFVTDHQDKIKMYVTLHSYGQLILYPWSYSSKSVSNHKELQNIAELAKEAIQKVHGTSYVVGPSNIVLYQSSGTSEDWMKGVAKIETCFALELPGGGGAGFDVPDTQITRIVTETFQGIKAMHKYVADKYVKNSRKSNKYFKGYLSLQYLIIISYIGIQGARFVTSTIVISVILRNRGRLN